MSGAMQFTRMFSGPSSTASVDVKLATPAFIAA